MIDSAILSGLTFFTALGGMGVTGVIGLEAIKAAAITAGIQFCTVIAVKRGLIKKQE